MIDRVSSTDLIGGTKVSPRSGRVPEGCIGRACGHRPDPEMQARGTPARPAISCQGKPPANPARGQSDGLLRVPNLIVSVASTGILPRMRVYRDYGAVVCTRSPPTATGARSLCLPAIGCRRQQFEFQ